VAPLVADAAQILRQLGGVHGEKWCWRCVAVRVTVLAARRSLRDSFGDRVPPAAGGDCAASSNTTAGGGRPTASLRLVRDAATVSSCVSGAAAEPFASPAGWAEPFAGWAHAAGSAPLRAQRSGPSSFRASPRSGPSSSRASPTFHFVRYSESYVGSVQALHEVVAVL
jgi:hypothetical protein